VPKINYNFKEWWNYLVKKN